MEVLLAMKRVGESEAQDRWDAILADVQRGPVVIGS